MLCIVPQAVDRLQVKLDHPSAQFQTSRDYELNKEQLNLTVSDSQWEAKKRCNGVFNGQRIPDNLMGNVLLQGLRTEGRLWRWIACSANSTLHTFFVDEGQKHWPENTVAFYT